MLNHPIRPAADAEEFRVFSNGGDWVISWHPPIDPPDGTRHGASAICLTHDDRLVFISEDGRKWGLPGGRPEGGESWEETLIREMREEACAKVSSSQLLGFGQSHMCIGSRLRTEASVSLSRLSPIFRTAAC